MKSLRRTATDRPAQNRRIIASRPRCKPAALLESARCCARSSMDRVLPSEGRGCWFDPSRARHIDQALSPQGKCFFLACTDLIRTLTHCMLMHQG